MSEPDHCRFCGGIIVDGERYGDLDAHASCVEPSEDEAKRSLRSRFLEQLSRSFGQH